LVGAIGALFGLRDRGTGIGLQGCGFDLGAGRADDDLLVVVAAGSTVTVESRLPGVLLALAFRRLRLLVRRILVAVERRRRTTRRRLGCGRTRGCSRDPVCTEADTGREGRSDEPLPVRV